MAILNSSHSSIVISPDSRSLRASSRIGVVFSQLAAMIVSSYSLFVLDTGKNRTPARDPVNGYVRNSSYLHLHVITNEHQCGVPPSNIFMRREHGGSSYLHGSSTRTSPKGSLQKIAASFNKRGAAYTSHFDLKSLNTSSRN